MRQVSAKPTLEESWKTITGEVTALDEAQVGGWKDDIDTLLVFVRAPHPTRSQCSSNGA